MGFWHDEAPAVWPDALDEAGDVAGFVLAILHSALLVTEHEGPEQHLAHGIARKHQPNDPLRSAKLGEALDAARRSDPAGECRVSDIIEHALSFRAELDRPAAVAAVRDR